MSVTAKNRPLAWQTMPLTPPTRLDTAARKKKTRQDYFSCVYIFVLVLQYCVLSVEQVMELRLKITEWTKGVIISWSPSRGQHFSTQYTVSSFQTGVLKKDFTVFKHLKYAHVHECGTWKGMKLYNIHYIRVFSYLNTGQTEPDRHWVLSWHNIP